MTVRLPTRSDSQGVGDEERPSRDEGAPESASRSGLLATVNVVLHYRRLVLGSIVVTVAILSALALSKPRTYTSTAAFMPHASGGALAGLSNLAAQLGVSVGKDDPTQSPDFYAEVIKSRGVLTTIAGSQYSVKLPTGMKQGSLADVLILDPAPPEDRLEAALRRLSRMIFVNVTRQTGIMHLNVTSPSPELSREIGVRLLRTLDEFNTGLRQNQAGAEEKFLEQREQEARGAHRVAENRVVEFLRSNREFSKSPSLNYEYSTITDEARYRGDVVATLTKARAQARIEAARNTPVITVLDQPNRPLRPDGRGLLRTGLLAVVLGGAIGIVLAFILSALRDSDDDEQARRFAELRRDALNDLRHPLRALLPRRSTEVAGR